MRDSLVLKFGSTNENAAAAWNSIQILHPINKQHTNVQPQQATRTSRAEERVILNFQLWLRIRYRRFLNLLAICVDRHQVPIVIFHL